MIHSLNYHIGNNGYLTSDKSYHFGDTCYLTSDASYHFGAIVLAL